MSAEALDQSQVTKASHSKTEALGEKYLIFRVGNELYGAPLASILEVIEPQDVSSLPESPTYCIGVMNLRGEVITVYDMRLRVSQNPETSKEQLFIVVASQEGKSAFLVDQMIEVRDFLEQDIDRDFQLHSKLPHEALKGVGKAGKKIVYLIDLNQFVAA